MTASAKEVRRQVVEPLFLLEMNSLAFQDFPG